VSTLIVAAAVVFVAVLAALTVGFAATAVLRFVLFEQSFEAGC
jgi:hypothetical protein